MQILTYHLKDGCSLLCTTQDDSSVSLVYGGGGGCTLEVIGETSGVWISLCGSLQINEAGLTQPMRAKEMVTTPYTARINTVGHGRGRWLAILGGRKTWAMLFASTTSSDSHLFSEKYVSSRQLRSKAIALARSTSQLESEAALYGVADSVAELQAPLHPAVARCPGRTYVKRRQVFIRLQRVRNFIAACCDRELDNNVLAGMANYSPCHFLRTFEDVYLETPHDYLIKQRMLRAEGLLRRGKLAVSEVAAASGFGNCSAFSRSFRKYFGKTASEIKCDQFSTKNV